MSAQTSFGSHPQYRPQETLAQTAPMIIDGSKAPERKQLQGFDPAVEAEVLSLLPEGLHDAQSDTWGWNFKWGTTGLCPIGDGYFYISHNAKDKQTGNQSSTVQLYKWTGNPDKAFELVE